MDRKGYIILTILCVSCLFFFTKFVIKVIKTEKGKRIGVIADSIFQGIVEIIEAILMDL